MVVVRVLLEPGPVTVFVPLPVQPSARLMVSDVGAMLSACEAGVGIAQIMQLGSKHLIAAGRLVELFPAWPGEMFPL